MLKCLKTERLTRRANNYKTSAEKHERLRQAIKEDKTDYDELLKQYRKENQNKSSESN